jgi:N-alpha-acetyltransferase 40
MINATGGKGGGGKSGKKKTKGGVKKIVKTKKMQSTAAGTDKVVQLRAAIFKEDGKDRDVLADFKAFQTFNRNGLKLNINFFTGGNLQPTTRRWMHSLTKKNMKEVYDKDYGWDDEDKMSELREKASRFLVVTQEFADGDFVDEKLTKKVAFVNFRFTLQGECYESMKGETCLFIYDIQVEPEYQRKGLGKHLMQLCELIGTKQRMKFLQLLIPNGNDVAVNFLSTKLKDYDFDATGLDYVDGDVEDFGFKLQSKCIDRQLKKSIQKVKAEQENLQTLAWDLSKALNDGLNITSNSAGNMVAKNKPQKQNTSTKLVSP